MTNAGFEQGLRAHADEHYASRQRPRFDVYGVKTYENVQQAFRKLQQLDSRSTGRTSETLAELNQIRAEIKEVINLSFDKAELEKAVTKFFKNSDNYEATKIDGLNFTTLKKFAIKLVHEVIEEHIEGRKRLIEQKELRIEHGKQYAERNKSKSPPRKRNRPGKRSRLSKGSPMRPMKLPPREIPKPPTKKVSPLPGPSRIPKPPPRIVHDNTQRRRRR